MSTLSEKDVLQNQSWRKIGLYILWFSWPLIILFKNVHSISVNFRYVIPISWKSIIGWDLLFHKGFGSYT